MRVVDSGERRTSDNRHPSRGEGAASKADAPRPGAHETTPTPRFAAPGTQIGPTPGAESLEGRRILGVGDGFGETWFKRFTVNLGHAEPEEVMTVWKREFSRLWPQEAAFRAHGARIVPGAVAEGELDGPVGRVVTGVTVDDAAPRHFTLRTPEGHMFAGWVRFKAAPAQSGTVATAEMIVRPSDPLYQLGLWFGGNCAEDRFWMHTLRRLAMRFAAPPSVITERRLLSRSFNWRAAGNVRHNAAIQTLLGQLGSAARAAARKIVGRA